LFCDVAQYKEIVAFDEGLFFLSREVIDFIPHLCSQNKDLQALQARAPYAPLPHTHTKHAHTLAVSENTFLTAAFFFLNSL
jgi:hypothetical protein